MEDVSTRVLEKIKNIQEGKTEIFCGVVVLIQWKWVETTANNHFILYIDKIFNNNQDSFFLHFI